MASVVPVAAPGIERTSTVVAQGDSTVCPAEEWLEAQRSDWSPNNERTRQHSRSGGVSSSIARGRGARSARRALVPSSPGSEPVATLMRASVSREGFP